MAKTTSKKQEVGNNIEVEFVGDKMVLTIDLKADAAPSGSGKTLIIASSRGNKKVNDEVFIGLNVYRYAQKKGK
jgi:hypothetical protein